MRRLLNIQVVFLTSFALLLGTLFQRAQGEEILPQGISAENLTLEALIKEAFSRNPDLKAKKAEYEAKRSKAAGEWLPEDPEVGMDVEGQSQLFKAEDRMNYEFMAMQSIPFPSKLFLKGVIASKEADMAYQNFKEGERNLIWRVEQSYYELFLVKKTLVALGEIRTLLEQFSQVVKARYEANQVTQADNLKVGIEISQLDVEIFNWQQREHVLEANISKQLNQPLETQYSSKEPTQDGALSLERPELERIALDKRPELKMLEIGIKRAKNARTLAKTEWLPDITFRVEARKFKGEDDVREYDNFIGFSFPLWSLARGAKGEWKSADEDVRFAESTYLDMKNEVLLRVHEAYARFESARNALKNYENIILPQAKQQVQVSLSAYEAGKMDILMLIDAQRTLKNVQIEYSKAVAEYEMGLSDLKLAIGDDLK
ncbi:MAG TPA: TolC family protein [Candidatus Omnitrophota bacterium]|nr:TolC family protein [Candidatus Omnitrophota bacterium]